MADTNTGQGTGQGEGTQGSGSGNTQGTGSGETGFNADDYVLKSELNNVVKERETWKRKAREIESKALSDEDLAAFEKMKADAAKAEEDRLAEKGKFKELKEKLEKEHASARQKDAEVLTKRDSVVRDLMVKNQILTAATGKAVDPAKVVKLLKDNFVVRYDDKDEPYVVTLDDDGTDALNDDGNAATVKEFVTKYIEANEDLQPANVRSGSGGGPNNRGTTKHGVLPSVDDQSNMTPEQIKELRAQKHAVVRNM